MGEPASYPAHRHRPITTDDGSTELCAICGALLAVHADTRTSRYWLAKRGERAPLLAKSCTCYRDESGAVPVLVAPSDCPHHSITALLLRNDEADHA